MKMDDGTEFSSTIRNLPKKERLSDLFLCKKKENNTSGLLWPTQRFSPFIQSKQQNNQQLIHKNLSSNVYFIIPAVYTALHFSDRGNKVGGMNHVLSVEFSFPDKQYTTILVF